MTRMSRFVAVGVVLAALLVAVAACGEEQTAEEAKQQLTTDLQAFDASAQKLSSLTVDSTVDEAQAAKDEVQTAWDKVVESAADVEEAQTANLETAWDDLAKAIDDLPGDAALGEAAASLKPHLDAVRAAYDDLYNGLQ